MMKLNEIKKMIQDVLPDAEISLKDIKGDGEHYSAVIKSNYFRGKNKVQQHQMVYNALKGNMKNNLHALELKTSLYSEKN